MVSTLSDQDIRNIFFAVNITEEKFSDDMTDELEELGGGSNSTSYKLIGNDGKLYALRVVPDFAEMSKEYNDKNYLQLHIKASEAGLAPKIHKREIVDGSEYIVMDVPSIYSFEHWILDQKKVNEKLGKEYTFRELYDKCIDVIIQLHDLGICHNDLKAANFIIGTDDKIYLIDFEYAELTNDENKFTDDINHFNGDLTNYEDFLTDEDNEMIREQLGEEEEEEEEED